MKLTGLADVRKGPGDLWTGPDGDDADEAMDEEITKLAEEYRNDPAKCREAEEWVGGTFDGDHYTEVTLALHQLHHTDLDKLLGSDLLTTLYRLAKVQAEAMDAELWRMADSAINDAKRREFWDGGAE